MKSRISALLLLLAGLMISPLASAQTGSSDKHPWFDSKFMISGGAYFTSQDYTLGAGIDLRDEDIDFGGKLGVDDSQTSFSSNLRWNFGDKWSFRLQTISFDVDGSAVLKEDISWNDVIFKAGSNASAGISNDIYRGFFGRNFAEGDNYEFGAGIGLHWMTVEAFIAGEIITGDGSNTEARRRSVDADLPLPNIGFWYWYSPSPRWMLTSRLDWLSASIGEYSGSLWNAAVGGQFQITDHIGVGVEFAYFALSGDVDKSGWNGSLETSSTGPLIYLTANW